MVVPLSANSSQPDWEPMSPALAERLLCGNKDAIEFYNDIAHWTHTYDDLIDGDKPLTHDQIHEFVWRMLFSIPLNPFYNAHQAMLRPLLMTGILNWIAANDMEKTKRKEELRISHVIRYAVGDILLACMAITGGIAHARANSRVARLALQDETWQHYSIEQGDCNDYPDKA